MIKLIFLVIIFSPFLLFAKMEDWNSDNIHSSIKEVCDLIDPDVIKFSRKELDNYRAGIFPSKLFSKLLGDLSRQSFSTYLNSSFTESDNSVDLIIQNEGYKLGIQECKKKSPLVANYLSQSIKKTNYQGKVLALFTTAFIFRGSYSVWMKLSALGKKIFSFSSVLPLSAWAYSFFSKNIDQHELTIELEKKCGPKEGSNYSTCTGNEVVAKFTQLEESMMQKSEDSLETKKYIKALVIQQIQTLNEQLQVAKSIEQKNIIKAHIIDRKSLLTDLQ